ncbi:hypothetical protein PanWU01x14_357610 [Parasponia andersonii]|uniref:Uncharacterized protein n=1 Tax=Parasponia andersonii TaxID=3476 RepID=A0A2P5A8J9_PARAD|nr:hypothetical protein PanWU01x14_357610 [Parasponia andersonii]
MKVSTLYSCLKSCLVWCFPIKIFLMHVTIYLTRQGAKKLRGQQETIDSFEGYSEQHISRLKGQLQLENDEQLKRISETIASRLREATARLEEQLAEEKAARVELQKYAKQAQKRSNEELSKLRVHLEKAQEELRRKGNCAIL